jgi:hypothetical protein
LGSLFFILVAFPVLLLSAEDGFDLDSFEADLFGSDPAGPVISVGSQNKSCQEALPRQNTWQEVLCLQVPMR